MLQNAPEYHRMTAPDIQKDIVNYLLLKQLGLSSMRLVMSFLLLWLMNLKIFQEKSKWLVLYGLSTEKVKLLKGF